MNSFFSPVVLNLILVNGLIFIFVNLLYFKSPDDLFPTIFHYFTLCKSDWVQPRPPLSPEVEGIQLVTYFFTHKDLFHFLFNMLALTVFGRWVEAIWGSKRFLEFYLFAGVFGGILITLFDPSSVPVIGASVSVSGVLVAFAINFPREKLLIFPFPIPIEARYYAIGFAVISLFLFWDSLQGGGGNISHFGHLAGMVAALVYLAVRRFLPR